MRTLDKPLVKIQTLVNDLVWKRVQNSVEVDREGNTTNVIGQGNKFTYTTVYLHPPFRVT